MKKPKAPSLNQIQKDEEKRLPEIKQQLSDEEINQILKQQDDLDYSKFTVSVLRLLSKHDWLPRPLIAKCFDIRDGGARLTVNLLKRKLVEKKLQRYKKCNRSTWLRITKEGQAALKNAT